MPNPQTPRKPAAPARSGKAAPPAAAGVAKAPVTSLTLPSRFRPRLLPVTIFVAVLMLGVRVGDIWLALGGDLRGPIGSVQAQQPAPAAATPPGPAAQPFKTDAGLPPLNPAAKVMTAAVDEHAPEGSGSLQAEVFQRLTERREELDRRTRELDQREALLSAAQQRIDQKVTELTELRTNIEGLLRQVDEKQTAQLESLVKIYETMKPKDAARIFEALELPVLLDVVERMREGKSAPVLAAMDPLKAKEVTASLIERRALPTLPK
ncbi:flagellar motility protein MotE (MotC chaperone) [Skermanella aerolata]|uniref:MotE family protein n=1 Tax=Skermanella aerolata TaxID=393310 RepID=UPI003D25127C